MEVQYVVAIVAGGLFGLIFFIGVCAYFYRKNKDKKLRLQIEKMYSDEKLSTMNYNFTADYEEAPQTVSASSKDGQLSIYDIIDNAAGSAEEGMEEITGNYSPD